MKKVLFIAIACLGFAFSSQAQVGFKAGGHIGLPVSDAEDVSSFLAGVDLAYLVEAGTNFYVGGATGYTNFFGEDVGAFEFEDFGIVPIAASGLYTQGDGSFLAGVDLGYAFFTNIDGSDGGFYYNPKVGYDFGAPEVTFSYKGVSEGDATIAGITAGFAYKFSY